MQRRLRQLRARSTRNCAAPHLADLRIAHAKQGQRAVEAERGAKQSDASQPAGRSLQVCLQAKVVASVVG